MCWSRARKLRVFVLVWLRSFVGGLFWFGFLTQVSQVGGIQLAGSSFSLCGSISLEEIASSEDSLAVPLCSVETWPTNLFQ